MRSIILALCLTIFCIAVYTNAAALPENPSENPDVKVPYSPQSDDQQYKGLSKVLAHFWSFYLLFWEYFVFEIAAVDETPEDDNVAVKPESRTLLLLLPLLFPNAFSF